MPSRPSYLNKEKPTRHNSEKQEKKLSKDFGGRKTANSGATFGQNDVITPTYEIEAKTTKSRQFILKTDDLAKMNKKCSLTKVALFIIEFTETGDEVVVINKADFYNLIGLKK